MGNADGVKGREKHFFHTVLNMWPFVSLPHTLIYVACIGNGPIMKQ